MTNMILAFLTGFALCAMLFGVIPWSIKFVRFVASKIKERREKRAADEERRWQALKPLLASGAITRIQFYLRNWTRLEHPYIQLSGSGFCCRCEAFRGPHVTSDTVGIGDSVAEILGTPGTEMKDMRRLAALFVKRIRLDSDIAVIKDDTVKNWGSLCTKPAVENLRPFRRKIPV